MNFLKKYNDAELIKSILKGNTNAFEKIYNKYYRFYFLTCLRYSKSKSDAEDMLQESCIKIYNSLHQYNPEKSSFLTWSKKIVINTCLMILRKKSLIDFTDNIFEIGGNIPVNAVAIDQLSLQELTVLVQSLPVGYRTIFNMYVIDGYTHKEISEILRISSSTSKTQLMKAKKFLQNKIAENDYSIIENYA